MADPNLTPRRHMRNKGLQCAECERPAVGLGLCGKHYKRLLKTRLGVPQKAPRDATPKQYLAFYSKPNDDTGCVEWTASVNTWGYGRVQINGARVLAHRVAYAEYVGPIPEGLYVLHKCDNRRCVNPAHLFLGTLQDNTDDMYAKGRGPKRKGEDHPQVKLTEDDVRSIRADARDKRIIAAQYGLNADYVRNIKRRLTWKHLP